MKSDQHIAYANTLDEALKTCDVAIFLNESEEFKKITNDEFVATIKFQVEKIVSQIDKKFTIHDFRVVTGQTHTNLVFDILVPYSSEMTDEQVRELVEEKIKNHWRNYYAVIKIDKSYV